MDLTQLDNKSKAKIVCLYYAKLDSSDNYYKDTCTTTITQLADNYNIKYNTLRNYKDHFDHFYPNSRKGWTKKNLPPDLEQISQLCKDFSIDELKNLTERIVSDSEQNDFSFFTIKTKDQDSVASILNNNKSIVFGGLNILKDSIKIGQPIFLVLGGDKTTWNKGLVGIGIISKEPYDFSYDSKTPSNFKVEFDVKYLLKKPITRTDLIPYENTYGVIGIGPMLQGEPNQAISQVNQKKTISVLQALLELSPEIDSTLQEILPSNIYESVHGCFRKLISSEVNLGETPSLETLTDDSIDVPSIEYTKKDFLNDVFVNEKHYNTICNILDYKKNIILSGPPGVGKTFMAKRLAYSILNQKSDKNIEIVQFHQSYSYEDFIVGFKPNNGRIRTIYWTIL